MGALTWVAGSSAVSAEPWSLIMLPDTQHYVDSSTRVGGFVAQTTWIVDHLDSRNIAFVTHIGDIVQHGSSTTEWERSEQAMDILHGQVPYGACVGDHDYNDEEMRSSGAEKYLERYGASRYAGMPWYGGSSPDGKSHYQRFTADGREFINISLEWEAGGSVYDPTSPLGWARTILDANPTTPTIISTHSYVWDKSGEEGRTNGIEEDEADGSSGEMLWSDLVANSPQVFMVVGGNFHKAGSQYDPDDPGATSNDGEFHQVSTNLAGLPVYEMLANYQDYPNGGDGWLRIIEFIDGGGAGGLDRIAVQTYSPTLDAYQTDGRSEFHFDLDFAARLDNIPARHNHHRVVFGQGDDTYIWKDEPASNFGSDIRLRMDTNYGGTSSNPMPRQGLIRFDIAFGDDGIPAGAQIIRAELRARQTDTGNGFRLHRMLVPWSQSTATWDALGDGIDIDGSDAMAAPDHETLSFMTEGESAGYSIFDVTASVQAWASGQANHGWAVMPRGSNQINLESFEGGAYGPELVVDYVLPGTEQLVIRTGQDAFVWAGAPDTNEGASSRIKTDGEDGVTTEGESLEIHGLLRFDLPVGTGAGAIPAGSTVVRAEIRWHLTDTGSGVAVHRMLEPWDEATVTWNSLDNGIDADGVQAALDPDLVTPTLYELDSISYTVLDITAAVQAWVDGQANHGVALLPQGNNKLFVESFQSGSKITPELVISYTP